MQSSQQYTRHQLRTSLDHNESMAFVKHPRVHSQAGSISSQFSTSSTLVDVAETPESPGDEHVMMQLDYILPVWEYPGNYIPSTPSSILLPEPSTTSPTPCSSSHHLVSSVSTRGSRLWLHRRRRLATDNQTTTASNTRSSFLTSLLHSRWPKSELEDPIFGQTTPRALSPHRQHFHDEHDRDLLPPVRERPPSTLSAPRSILTRVDSRDKRSVRSFKGSVKFVEKPKLWEYEEYYGDYGFDNERQNRWNVGQVKDDVDEADSVMTLPPSTARSRARSESILRRFIGSSGKSHARGHGKGKKVQGIGEKLVISGPMPLVKAASMRDLKQSSDPDRKGNVKEKGTNMASGAGATKKGNKLRTFWGRLYCGMGVA
ncbi:hypothetical protein HETIRDRAFT_167279 [Heterobasidion irregulare TC 32-1]|uniref:Uncharacterized protein n=1 Tax=Heterobasidion irregulare (strain TC 32-1) TaxID=747525 RepID=W4KPD3_HETIT|nr:uncharacterized protein HETIRDRAFT_167279 [Heterobasidion irregulare TC 32-1]ETW87703.1 hypothetical protein HETIRDRAFT_167279 [Heterobasidion irregulare TC 32-1]